MKLPGGTKSKIIIDKNGENVPHLKNIEVVLLYCNIVNNDYQLRYYYLIVILSIMIIRKIQQCCMYLFQVNYLVNG